ncbi:fusion protein of aspartate kinase and homoserine dehydrogenase [Gracilaria domingensis]|nr:fusion protein of aspartate kinase and homoserine dehydrogenase [Gracilaria domingensis]
MRAKRRQQEWQCPRRTPCGWWAFRDGNHRYPCWQVIVNETHGMNHFHGQRGRHDRGKVSVRAGKHLESGNGENWANSFATSQQRVAHGLDQRLGATVGHLQAGLQLMVDAALIGREVLAQDGGRRRSGRRRGVRGRGDAALRHRYGRRHSAPGARLARDGARRAQRDARRKGGHNHVREASARPAGGEQTARRARMAGAGGRLMCARRRGRGARREAHRRATSGCEGASGRAASRARAPPARRARHGCRRRRALGRRGQRAERTRAHVHSARPISLMPRRIAMHRGCARASSLLLTASPAAAAPPPPPRPQAASLAPRPCRVRSVVRRPHDRVCLPAPAARPRPLRLRRSLHAPAAPRPVRRRAPRSAPFDARSGACRSPSTPAAPVSAWTVHKFGGSSLANAECVGRVADIVASSVTSSSKLLIVVSAASGVTDALHAVVSAAASRDPHAHYAEQLDLIADTHRNLAQQLLPADARDAFLATLTANIKDLVDLLRATWIARSVSERIRDLIVGHGELWSAQLLWALCRSRHRLVCSWMDSRDVLVARPSETSMNRKIVLNDRSKPLLYDWLRSNPTDVIIATGYICQDKEGVPSTLGRNGSDYSASAFANLLSAKELNIWTDVDGVYSADPRVVKDAIVIPDMSYKEAAELAYFGAKVLHPDTMAPIIESSIPMRIRNTFNKDLPGTLVRQTDLFADRVTAELEYATRDMAGVKGFTTVQDVSIVNIEGTGMIGVPGIASRAFQALFSENVSVILIAQASSEFSICIAIPSVQREVATESIRRAFRPELADGLISTVSSIPDCSILAMVGEQMQQRPGVSSRLFASLTRAGVNIVAMAQGSSEHNISVVVDAKSESRALRAAHSSFYLSDQTVSLGLIGPGVVGSAFLEQIQSQLETLEQQFSVDLRVRGIATSRKMVFGEPINLDNEAWRGLLKSEEAEPLDLDSFADHIQDTALPHAVICDCTASEEVSAYYEKWLKRGIHIITPNKKANSGPMEYYRAMRTAQRRFNSHFLYEANVGAGLPIISSIRDLLRTGDQFLDIEGIFSGTLSFIFNEFDGSEPFSAIVAKAKANGYTEPDPRDDLSGMDVARKVVIVAREIGIKVELDQVPVESLVPKELQGSDVTVDEFMQRLPDFDSDLTSMANEAKKAGELLRYVGVVDCKNKRCAVELRRYSESHPFGRLQGSDNIVSFRTIRYDAQPLVVQGPGAGAAVTAAGVFGDLLRLTGYLGAPSSEDGAN